MVQHGPTQQRIEQEVKDPDHPAAAEHVRGQHARQSHGHIDVEGIMPVALPHVAGLEQVHQGWSLPELFFMVSQVGVFCFAVVTLVKKVDDSTILVGVLKFRGDPP